MDTHRVVGRTVREVLPGIEDAWIDEFAQVVESGEPSEFLHRVGPLDRWYEGRAFSIGADRFAVTFLEVTNGCRRCAARGPARCWATASATSPKFPRMVHAAAEIVGTALGATRAGFGRVDAGIEFIDIETDWTAPGIASIVGRHRFSDFGELREDLRRGEALVIEDVRTVAAPATTPGPCRISASRRWSTCRSANADARWRFSSFTTASPPLVARDAGIPAQRRRAPGAGVARMRAEEEQRILNEEFPTG